MLERSPLRSATTSVAGGGLHPIFAVVFGLNYMMGSGFLTLPRAFVECSVGLGIVLTVVIAIGANASAECLLDVMARAKKRVAEQALPGEAGSFYRCVRSDHPPTHTAPPPPKQRYAQVSDLIVLYLGVPGHVTYLVMLVGFMTGSLWCYAAIFAKSLEVHGYRFFGDATYKLYVVAFGCVVVPLACRDLAEQKGLQSVLALGRALMLLLMTVTAGFALWHGGPLAPIDGSASWRSVLSAAPVVAFSCTLHHSVPQICAPIVPANDTRFDYFILNWVFRCAFASSVAVYVIFAGTIATFFGDLTRSSVNLDWANYRILSASAFTRDCGLAISRFIILYPAVNVVAAYPLSAVTLGDALLAAYRTKYEIDDVATHLPPSSHQIILFRLLAAVTPLVGAVFADDISSITRITGVFGICMCGAYPGILSLVAKRVTPGPTVHTSVFNTALAAVCLVVVGAALALTPILSAAFNAQRETAVIKPLKP